jgi:hypothetical protein
MTCPRCNQEYDDNQTCPNCAPEQVIDTNEGLQPAGNPAAPASPPDPDQDNQPPNPGKNAINAGGAKITAGRDVTIVLKAIEDADQSHKAEEERSIYDFVKALSRRPGRHYRPSEADLEAMVGSLIKDRVILISSSYDEYALDTAWEVIEAMPGSTDRSYGSLAFEDTAGKGVDFSPEKLCEQRPETEPAIVLLIDAFDSQANSFTTSMLGHSARVEGAKQNLRNSKLFLVVVVNHEFAIEMKLSQPDRSYESLSYWPIPFLEPFFQRWFSGDEQLLAELTKQRANGKWEEEESSFTKQVLSYHANDVLRDVINNGGPKDPDSAAKRMLEGADPVKKTVLYTATFFNEITSPEFCRVVESLLGSRMMLKDSDISTNGATPATTKIEVPLRRIWNEEKDEIFTELLVETSTANDSPLTVSLSEFNLAEPLRKLFEKRHRFYVLDQFKGLQQTGIFFFPSLRLAKNTTELAVELAQLYPDEFNEGWIVTMVMRIKQYFATPSDEERVEDPMFHFLSNTQPGAFHVAFARVSEVCKRFLKTPQQKNVVRNSLEYLMQNEYHQEVLWLVKQLKSNPEFDDWYWLKQLLHRGNLSTKYLTYYYILSYLKQLGTRVYEGLKRLEEWLPPTDRSKLTDFDTFIFRILIKYFLDTIARFNAKHYGRWPSRYALFAPTDEKTADARFASLANCLLHPGVDRTLGGLNIDGTRIDLIGILLAEWSFILLGTPSTPPTADKNGKEDEPNEAQNCTALQMFELLIKQFLSRLDLQQRLELLKYWIQYDSALLIFGSSHTIAIEQRNVWKWKKALVQRLIRELKLIPPAKPSRTNSTGLIVTSSNA